MTCSKDEDNDFVGTLVSTLTSTTEDHYILNVVTLICSFGWGGGEINRPMDNKNKHLDDIISSFICHEEIYHP
jgi:hypothetical protein